MNNESPLALMTVDEIVSEAICRERMLKTFYEQAMPEVGRDARLLMGSLCSQHTERITQLESLLDEIADLRELTTPIAD